MLYFKQELISCAKQIIQAKETQDDCKVLKDFCDIEQNLKAYYSTGVYNQQEAISLDNRLRKDYPLIEKLYSLPSNNRRGFGNNKSKNLPPEINNLDVDQYGILITVLLKKKIINNIEDSLE